MRTLSEVLTVFANECIGKNVWRGLLGLRYVPPSATCVNVGSGQSHPTVGVQDKPLRSSQEKLNVAPDK